MEIQWLLIIAAFSSLQELLQNLKLIKEFIFRRYNFSVHVEAKVYACVFISIYKYIFKIMVEDLSEAI